LGVAFGTEGSRFNKMLIVKHAFRIDILPSLYVINSTEDTVEAVPEDISEDALCIRTGSVFHSNCFKIVVNSLCDTTGNLSLALRHMMASEKELSVKVRYLNSVIISYY